MPATSVTNLMADFCAAANLYCNAEHLRQVIDTEAVPGEIAGVAELAALGRGTVGRHRPSPSADQLRR